MTGMQVHSVIMRLTGRSVAPVSNAALVEQRVKFNSRKVTNMIVQMQHTYCMHPSWHGPNLLSIK